MGSVRIILRKLRRPRVAADFVARDDLLKRLETGCGMPLTLLSAPGGYGKTSLVAHWLAGRSGPSAWLSLEREDSDPLVFVSYLVAAVRTALPDACAETLRQLDGPQAPTLAALAASLSNDLEALSAPLLLVIDNYQCIEAMATHALVDGLLAYPSSEFHLVLITRHDPPLSLGVLRVREMMHEMRVRDLRFTDRELAALLVRNVEQTSLLRDAVVSTVVSILQRRTEGWPVGVRLAVRALRQGLDLAVIENTFGGRTPEVQQYFTEEILTQQRVALEHLLRTSILDRFCAPLCEAVGGDDLDGHQFMHVVASGALLSTALDEHLEWHRFHPLFQEFLRLQLEIAHSAEEIAALHRRAADWLEAHGLLEDAMPHALAGEGAAAAGRLLIRHRNPLINREQRQRLDDCLRLLPQDTVENEPELLMMKAWLLHHQGRHVETPAVLERIETLIEADPQRLDATSLEALRGGVLALRSLQEYCDGRAGQAMDCAEQALQHLHADRTHASVTAYAVLAGARQMSGDLQGARLTIEQALANATGPIDVCRAPLLATRGFIEWMAADLSALQWTAIQNYNLSDVHFATEGNQGLGRHFLALVQYQRNELALAEATLAPALAPEQRPRLGYRTEMSFLMAAVHQALGRAERAREVIDVLCEHLLHKGDMPALFRAQACQADLALRQGRLDIALEWARNFDPGPVRFVYRFFNAPHLTLARVWIAEGSPDSHEQAERLLDLLEMELSGRHNRRFLIEVLALRALLKQCRGDEAAAGEPLARAIELAQPGGFIRLFVDLGQDLVKPLKRLLPGPGQARYIGQLLAAFNEDWLCSTVRQPLGADLTRREMKILKLLAARLSNLEISDQLCISRATVKRHTQNIYGKLHASSRREAVAIARKLNILIDD